MATATTSFADVEDVTILATYVPESSQLDTSSDEATISVQIPQTVLRIDDITIKAGESVTFTAIVTDQIGII